MGTLFQLSVDQHVDKIPQGLTLTMLVFEVALVLQTINMSEITQHDFLNSNEFKVQIQVLTVVAT